MCRECCCGMMQEVWASEKAGLEQKALALEGDLQQALERHKRELAEANGTGWQKSQAVAELAQMTAIFDRKEAAWTGELQDLKQQLGKLQSAQADKGNEHVQTSAEPQSAEELPQIAASEESLATHGDQLVEVLAQGQAQVPTCPITSEAEMQQAISKAVDDTLQSAWDEVALAQEAKTAKAVQVLCQASCCS